MKVLTHLLNSNVKNRQDDGNPLSNPSKYHRLVGSILYLIMTRPDISHTVQTVSQFVGKPHISHLTTVYQILRYICGTLDRGLFYSYPLTLIAYANADWTGCPATRWSIIGWCIFLGGSLISWECKKQPIVSKSSTEVEYHFLSSTSSETIWLRRLLRELGVIMLGATPLFADKTSAVKIATNPVFHE